MDKMDRVARAVWELRNRHPEVDHVRVETYLDREGDPQVLSTDVSGGVLWIDVDGNDHRQVVLPTGKLARDAEWLAKRREERVDPD